MQDPAQSPDRSRRPHRRGSWRRGAAGVASGLVTLALVGAGCSMSSGGGAGGGTTITLYNGQHEQTTDALVKAFEKKTGIDVKVRNDSESVFVNQIETEGSASPADVIYTENSLALEQLQSKHLLAAIDPSTLAAVPARYSSPTGHWVGVSARVSVMIYNTGRLTPAELPKSVMDLALPAWKGELGLAQGEVDFFPIVASIIDAHGQAAAAAWLAGVKNNAGANIYPDNETLTSEVGKGQVEIGIINHYYWYRLRAEGGAASTAVASFAPGDPGYIIDVSGAGVLASSKEQTAAQRFVAFLVSAPGQEILARSDSFEYPLGSGVTTAKPLPPFDALQPSSLTVGGLGNGAAAIALLQQAGLA
jgi:iron(III) transport system substrate-binding protein